MEHINYLTAYNNDKINIAHLQGKTLTYKSKVGKIDFREIKKLLGFFSTIEHKYGLAKLKYIIIYEKEVVFEDKLTIVLFECLLYDLRINKSKDVQLRLHAKRTINTEELEYSCLFVGNNEELKDKFNFNLHNTHFRRVVSLKENDENLDSLSKIMGDITSFLKNCNIKSEYSSRASEIAIELLDNALDHSKSDCLIDIDVTQTPYTKYGDDKQQYQAVNIVVINFSDKLLGEDIKEILDNYNENCGQQFKKLLDYRNIHEEYFKEDYSIKEFYILSAFQNKITGRSEKALTGGRGLTKLIKGIQDYADTYKCYVASGSSVVFFVKDYIKQDENQWVGFNESNCFNDAPSYDVIKKSPLNIIGTAYNLNFVFKKEV